jgi:hypothetical protein
MTILMMVFLYAVKTEQNQIVSAATEEIAGRVINK